MIVCTWVPSQILVHKPKPEPTQISHEFERPGQSPTQTPTSPRQLLTQVGLGHADSV